MCILFGAMAELAVFVPAEAEDPALRVHHDGMPPAAGNLRALGVLQAHHLCRPVSPRAAAVHQVSGGNSFFLGCFFDICLFSPPLL